MTKSVKHFGLANTVGESLSSFLIRLSEEIENLSPGAVILDIDNKIFDDTHAKRYEAIVYYTDNSRDNETWKMSMQTVENMPISNLKSSLDKIIENIKKFNGDKLDEDLYSFLVKIDFDRPENSRGSIVVYTAP